MHPHAEWTRQALEAYTGRTETLTLEFKSYRSLLSGQGKSRQQRVLEAARDVAGMANEQGGTIIYGIEESDEPFPNTAQGFETGFSPGDGVNREWFIQVMRDHIHPPLAELDVAQVPLDDDHFALVVMVPQARGVARQTDDLHFPRRDAQGLHNMTVQEIEDVRARLDRPTLELRLQSEGRLVENETAVEIRGEFEIVNTSSVTASFAVVTLGLLPTASVTSTLAVAWRPIRTVRSWKISRTVIAASSWPDWSPITPGFTIVPQYAEFRIQRAPRPEGVARTVGLARLDHDGGGRVYRIDFYPHQLLLRLEAFPGELDQDLIRSWNVPDLFLR